ncbi:MAG: restriction endonuclease subunit S [Saprospiraceae bacterium]|nr:restriction endonuclease subunit S [Saprospiraceae bacterium]
MKRYDRYKDSGIEWIGEIPEHWEVKRLKYVVEMNSGNGITSEMIKEEGDFPVFGGNGIRGYYSHYTHEGSFILIGRQGALCGNINYSNGKFWASEHAIVCTPKIEYNVKWFGESLRTMNLNQYSVSAAQPGLSVENLKVLQIPIPPLPEQHAIAAYLDRKTAEIDALIVDKKRLLELYEEEKTALINQAVTKGITPGVPMKDSGVEWLGEVPEHWEVKKMKYVIESVTGGGTPSTLNPLYWDGTIPWVSAKDMKQDFLFFSEDYITKLAIIESSTNYFEDERVIIVVRSGILKHTFPVAINKVPITINQDLKALKPAEAVSCEFLFWKLKGHSQDVLTYCNKMGATVDSIEMQFFMDFSLSFPSLVEQHQIVRHIESENARIDAKKAKTEKLIELLVEYRAALISEVVTGNVRIVGL